MASYIQRRKFLAALGGAAAWPLAARAQQGERMRRIGVLMPFAEDDPDSQPRAKAFERGLNELGWREGQNVQIDYRWAAGEVDRMATNAMEVVGSAPDVILAATTTALEAAYRATHTVPIVFVVVSDPVGGGFVSNLPHPGGNVTGFTNVEPSLGGKWLELLKEVAPRVARVALMYNPRTAPSGGDYFLRPFEAAAASLAIKPIAAPVHDVAAIEDTVAALARQPDSGLIAMPDIFTTVNRDRIISLAARFRVPTIYPYRYFAVGGGLMSYGVDNLEAFRRSASYVDRILKGEKTADLPVQAPTKYEFVINLRTAKALGLQIPDKLLALADEVIE